MEKIRKLKEEVHHELTTNILPYWLHLKDERHGGFYGEVSGLDTLEYNANKGAIQQARILWTFSAAYRVLGDEAYLAAANHAFRFIIDYLYDKEFGGVYWCVNYKGDVVDSKKQIYALGFAIYGLSEYHRATGDMEALDYAIRLYDDIEKYSFDTENNGYCEAFTRDWEEISDMRLSDKDENERKTMNTHLHILEPYTNLYRVFQSEFLKDRLINLIELFTEKILNPKTFHLDLFFDDYWKSKYNYISYGHDIEASWLLHEALLEIDDDELLKRHESTIKSIAEAATEGYLPQGGMIYEMKVDEREIDADRHWWVQAEAVVGYTNIYQHFGDNTALDKALSCWNFIKTNLIDINYGEWFWSIKANGETNTDEDKAGFWKCPYHNGRMCIEIIERFETT